MSTCVDIQHREDELEATIVPVSSDPSFMRSFVLNDRNSTIHTSGGGVPTTFSDIYDDDGSEDFEDEYDAIVSCVKGTQSITMRTCMQCLVGKAQYWVNTKTIYQQCIKNDTFSILHLKFKLSDYDTVRVAHGLKPLRWRISPKKCRYDDGRVNEKFHVYMGYFASDLFKIIGNIFPYQASPDTLVAISSTFCATVLGEKFADLFFEFKSLFPDNSFAKSSMDIIDLFRQKLANKFIGRRNHLKELEYWIYRPHEQKLDGKKKECGKKVVTANHANKHAKKRFPIFDYKGYKPFLIKRIKLESLQSKSKRKVDQ